MNKPNCDFVFESGACCFLRPGHQGPHRIVSVELERIKRGECRVPPPGWTCSREPGHEGPCAARPTE